MLPATGTSVPIGLEGSKSEQYGREAWHMMHISGDPAIYPLADPPRPREDRRQLRLSVR